MVELIGRYANPTTLAKLEAILAGHGRDRPSTRTVRSLRRNPAIDSDKRDQIVNLYGSGETLNQIAEAVGVHRATVANVIRASDIEKRWGVIDRHLEEARTLYESGLSLKKVGEHFGVSYDQVRTAFIKHGIPIRPRNGWKT